MEISEIKDFVVWAKKQGIRSFEINGIKVEFAVELPANTGELDLTELNKSTKNEDLTEDDLKYWSS